MKRTILTLLATGMIAAAGLAGTTAIAGSDASEIALFQNAAHGIDAAIKAAEGATGGLAVEAEFDEKNGTGVWDILTVTGTTRTEVRIDATTGEVIRTKDKSDVTDREDHVTPDMLGAPLADLIAKAEAESGGRVIEIEYEFEDGTARGIEVEVVMPDGSVHEFLMDQSGAMAPATDDGDHDEAGDEAN